ncbi:phosphatidylinositol N-acetylglucosaminyltransferase [Saccharomycopsis crataegensis]|uniref:Phosphatidylinositol N-acetylglucosaminyltransferase n=1 Tax=Saccharomycopsis crataegensis TaxID=43959 RepID=A0AAV5QRP1_9ASCO|nr:phosphatidylinositol N-acetylglucosaminyltransferase [Saccharomycopsis crataegensis]
MKSNRHFQSSSNLVAQSKQKPRTYKQPWRKLMWLDQNYPDNYVDSSFLSQLKRNTTVSQYSYWKLVSDFSLISMHLCDTSIVIIIFYGLYNRNWSPYMPTLICSLLTILGYFAWDFLAILKNKVSGNLQEKLSTLKSSLLIVFTILTLSPVLRSLTKSTSSDSIWALSTWLTIFNVICHNYEFDISKEIKYRASVLSTNILFSNVIVLSSRLSSNMSVFCFILVSIQVYGLFPVFQYRLRKNLSHTICSWLGIVYFAIVSMLMSRIIQNYIIVFSWFSINFFIIFFCPGYFIFLQQYKNELQGPWDPARPKF